ncbi:uncharacterized protein PRCAT00003430001 [Priceomyces carsonii]|uniref:uncharacterized protein n=1 Tax=Priceomyces carsonii TaxID=28549 RepID=UPI002ED9B0B1|nr:unnamed protein product [Priceomyces carsonii]
MRRVLRKLIILLIIVFTVITVTCLSFENLTHLLWKAIVNTEPRINDFWRDDRDLRNELLYSKHVYGGYEHFLKDAINGDIKNFRKKDLAERCKIFFDHFQSKNPNWGFDEFKSFHFEKNIVKKKKYFENKFKQLKLESTFSEIGRKDFVAISKEFQRAVNESREVEQKMADTITLMRIYGKCFLNEQEKSAEQAAIFEDFSSHIFPFIAKLLPTFESLNGETTPRAFPVFDGNQYTSKTKDFDGTHIIDYMHKNSNGRGIVVSASKRHVKDLVKLIRVLRALNNELPIEVVHKGDIGKYSAQYITFAATADRKELLDPINLSDSDKVSPEIDLLRDLQKFGSYFPKQEIWFVNVTPSIPRAFKYSFGGYFNKILALIFNSFREVIMLDVDVVPLIPVKEFFEMKQYMETSALFFKDRSLRDTNDFIETNFFAKLFPVNKNSIDSLFDIPLVNKTLHNSYMKGWRHNQEAGVVVVDKVKHFMGILMMLPLTLWKEPVKSSIWGDKEMFWLGFAMAGDENYNFNTNSAASVGEITSNSLHQHYVGSLSQEICSSHPGQIDDSGKLLWINSGFDYCKKNTYYRDKNKFPFSEMDINDLSNLFKSPLKIRHSIVPPDLPVYRTLDNPEVVMKEHSSLLQKQAQDLQDLDSGRINQVFNINPQDGWLKSPICTGYFYCAYDIYDGSEKFDSKGKVYEFDDTEVKFYDYIGKIWTTGKEKKRMELHTTSKNQKYKGKG